MPPPRGSRGFASGRFEADVDDVRMDGNVTSGFLGADVGAECWLAGVALGVSEGDGSYTLLNAENDDSGTVKSVDRRAGSAPIGAVIY